MDISIVTTLFVFLLEICYAGNKYSTEKNKLDDDSPFRMMKVNLLWNKAKKRLDKETLVNLYQDLKHQDQLEIDLKKKKVSSQDEDGEFEALVTRKSLDVIIKYGLEGIHPGSTQSHNNRVYDDHQDAVRWEQVMADKKLNKLWKKAQLSGFNDEELGTLRSELFHHLNKVEELKAFHSDLGPIDKELGNSVSDFQEKQDRKRKHIDLKEKHRALRDSFDQLEDQISRGRVDLNDKIADGFHHPKVIEMWFSAKKSNFTQEELSSLKEELTHFEHKIKKLEYLENENQKMGTKLNQKNVQLSDSPETKYKLADKVFEYTRKVKKYEADLRHRIQQASRHNEL